MSDQDPADPLSQLDRLNVGIDDLRAEVKAEREARESETRARERETTASKKAGRRSAAAIGLALVVAIVSVIYGVQANNAAHTAKRTADQLIVDRTEARIARCEADNDFAEKHNKLTREGIKTFQIILDNPGSSEAAKAFATERKAGYTESVVPLRDCSPAAVEAFYTKP